MVVHSFSGLNPNARRDARHGVGGAASSQHARRQRLPDLALVDDGLRVGRGAHALRSFGWRQMRACQEQGWWLRP